MSMSTEADQSIAATRRSDKSLAEPLGVSFYLRFCEAIERFTAASVAQDAACFHVRGADLRYVIERHLFFALIADRGLYRYFVARECGAANNDGDSLSDLAKLLAPFLWRQPPKFVGPGQSFWMRILRSVGRRYGRAILRSEGTGVS